MANNISTGNAGEYFVAGELERHGFTVAIPMSNVKDFDILAIDRETYKQYAIQVKTTGFKKKKWILSKKNEDLVADNIIYFFVALNELDMPEYHIVPARVVAESIKKEYQKWLHTPGKSGQKHNDTTIRNFYDEDDKYLNRWDFLSVQSKEDQVEKKISLIKKYIGHQQCVTKYYELLEELGDLKENYMEYMESDPVDCDFELRKLGEADYDMATALLTMLLREDYFSNGAFEKRLRSGQVDKVLNKMKEELEKRKQLQC